MYAQLPYTYKFSRYIIFAVEQLSRFCNFIFTDSLSLRIICGFYFQGSSVMFDHILDHVPLHSERYHFTPRLVYTRLANNSSSRPIFRQKLLFYHVRSQSVNFKDKNFADSKSTTKVMKIMYLKNLYI